MDLNEIKKIKIFDRLVLWGSRNKFHVKDLDRPHEHGTMSFLKDGKIDIHRKNEKNNTYQPEGILDLKKFISTFGKNPPSYLAPLLEMANQMKPVNFTEKEFSNLSIGLFPDLSSLSISNKKSILEIPPEAISKFVNIKKIPWLECKNKDFRGGIVYRSDDMVGFIQKTENGNYVFILLNDKTLEIKNKIEDTWFKLDPPTWKP